MQDKTILPPSRDSLELQHTFTHNLPMQPTPFMGREQEVAKVCELLSRPEVLCWLLQISVLKQGRKQQFEQLSRHLPYGKMEQERLLLAPSATHFLQRISEVASTGDVLLYSLLSLDLTQTRD